MDTNEIKMFEQKMIDSAFIDAVDYDPKVAVRAVGARKMKMKGVCSFNEYITSILVICRALPEMQNCFGSISFEVKVWF